MSALTDDPTDVAQAMLLGWEHIPWGRSPTGAWIKDDDSYDVTYCGRRVLWEESAKAVLRRELPPTVTTQEEMR
jgi:hypothetical protein